MDDDRSRNENGLNPRQQAFCDRYVWHFSDPSGSRSATQAAIEAGYSPTSAATMATVCLKKAEVRTEIRRQTEALFHEAVPLAAATLIELMTTGTAAQRKSAARDVLDQAGLQIITKTEATLHVVDQRTPAQMLLALGELAARNPEIAARIAHLLPAPPIEAEFLEVTSSVEEIQGEIEQSFAEEEETY